MPSHRKFLAGAAVCLALAGGWLAGAVVGSPLPSGAEDTADDTTDDSGPPDGPWRERVEHRGELLATAAEALGITEDELWQALREGTSIAQLAEDEGVDVQTVVDALVATATERLEEAIDELPERMSDLVNREGLRERTRGGGPGRFGPRLPGAPDGHDA